MRGARTGVTGPPNDLPTLALSPGACPCGRSRGGQSAILTWGARIRRYDRLRLRPLGLPPAHCCPKRPDRFGVRSRTITLSYKSSSFHPVEFEFDTVSNATKVDVIDTHAHPNRPSTLAEEDLSIETVYRRSGFDVTKSGEDNVIPASGTGANGTWSDAEMHDAMQTYWSRFANRARWSLWTLFAGQHDRGHGLGGIMFDDIGPNHRQGTAIFTNSFISDPPAGETHAAAWIKRMKFWTAK